MHEYVGYSYNRYTQNVSNKFDQIRVKIGFEVLYDLQ